MTKKKKYMLYGIIIAVFTLWFWVMSPMNFQDMIMSYEMSDEQLLEMIQIEQFETSNTDGIIRAEVYQADVLKEIAYSFSIRAYILWVMAITMAFYMTMKYGVRVLGISIITACLLLMILSSFTAFPSIDQFVIMGSQRIGLYRDTFHMTAHINGIKGWDIVFALELLVLYLQQKKNERKAYSD